MEGSCRGLADLDTDVFHSLCSKLPPLSVASLFRTSRALRDRVMQSWEVRCRLTSVAGLPEDGEQHSQLPNCVRGLQAGRVQLELLRFGGDAHELLAWHAFADMQQQQEAGSMPSAACHGVMSLLIQVRAPLRSPAFLPAAGELSVEDILIAACIMRQETNTAAGAQVAPKRLVCPSNSTACTQLRKCCSSKHRAP